MSNASVCKLSHMGPQLLFPAGKPSLGFYLPSDVLTENGVVIERNLPVYVLVWFAGIFVNCA